MLYLPEHPTAPPAFLSKPRFIKGNFPWSLTTTHVKSVLYTLINWDIFSPEPTPIIVVVTVYRTVGCCLHSTVNSIRAETPCFHYCVPAPNTGTSTQQVLNKHLLNQ